jgi:Anti-sigma-K factor rskA.
MSIRDLYAEQRFLNEKTDLLDGADLPPADGLPDRLAAIGESNREILERYPADAARAAVEAKLAARKEPLRFTRTGIPPWRTVTLAAAACCAIALTVTVVTMNPSAARVTASGILSSAERSKGTGAKLFVYRKDGTQAVLLAGSTRVRKDDVLQLSYLAGGDAWGAIVSVDGNGTVTRHFPDSGDLAGKLETSGEIALGFSYQLDDAPSFERFILVTGSKQFSIAGFSDEISRMVRNGLPAGFDLTVFLPAQTRATDILLLK